MLPFLTKNEAQQGAASAPIKRESDTKQYPSALEVAVKEMFEATDDKSRAQAFRAAFQLLELQPHEESPHG